MGLVSISDTNASFAASGLVGAPVNIVSGRGKGQRRRIVSVSGQTLYLDNPWLILPDTTSVYQIGGITYRWLSGDFRYVPAETDTPRSVEIVFQPTKSPGELDLRFYVDFAATPILMASTRDSRGNEGTGANASSPDIVIDTTQHTGYVIQRMDGHRELYTSGPRWVAIELVGVSNRNGFYLYEITVNGVAK